MTPSTSAPTWLKAASLAGSRQQQIIMPASDISAIKVDGVHTDVVITPYSDRVMIVVSQTGTMGTLVRQH